MSHEVKLRGIYETIDLLKSILLALEKINALWKLCEIYSTVGSASVGPC